MLCLLRFEFSFFFSFFSFFSFLPLFLTFLLQSSLCVEVIGDKSSLSCNGVYKYTNMRNGAYLFTRGVEREEEGKKGEGVIFYVNGRWLIFESGGGEVEDWTFSQLPLEEDCMVIFSSFPSASSILIFFFFFFFFCSCHQSENGIQGEICPGKRRSITQI